MKRLSMRKIREALRLSFEGLSTREMALSLAIGRTTLREYLGRARDGRCCMDQTIVASRPYP